MAALGLPEVQARSLGETPSTAGGTAAVSIVPADGKPRGIRLRAQNVNTVITQDATGVWATTDLEVQLQNRGKEPVVMPIGMPGPQVTAFVTPTITLPQISEVTLNKVPLALGAGGRADIRASATITLPVESTAVLRVRYRQAVPVSDGLAAYAYPLTAGNVWAGAPESLNVALTFSPPIADEQMMYATGGTRSPRPATYVWSWNGVKAPGNVAVAFMTSEWWRELEAARSASAAPNAGLAEHTALAERYWRLATQAPPAFAPRASFYDRNFPLALAAWRAGIAAATPETPRADLARAHERLAGLYLAQGNREGGAAAQTYLQLAVEELGAAVALNPEDGDLAASAAVLGQQLAHAAAGRGDGVSAAVHTARLTALATGRAAPSLEQEAQQRASTLAEAAVASGDLAGARRLLVDAFGEEVLALPGARPPMISQVILEIRSRPGHREIAVQFVDADQGRSAAKVAAQAATALQRVAPVVSAGGGLTVTLAYPDSAALVAAQARLAAALPSLPELALLSSALSTRRLAWPEHADVLARVSRYEERVDLSRSVAVWDGEAAILEAAAAEAEASGEALNRLRAAVWRGDARAWRDLGALSRVTYQVELREQGAGPAWLQARVHQFYQEGAMNREWVVRAGETRQLEAAILGWRYDRLALLAGAGVLVTAVVAGLLWLLSR